MDPCRGGRAKQSREERCVCRTTAATACLEPTNGNGFWIRPRILARIPLGSGSGRSEDRAALPTGESAIRGAWGWPPLRARGSFLHCTMETFVRELGRWPPPQRIRAGVSGEQSARRSCTRRGREALPARESRHRATAARAAYAVLMARTTPHRGRTTGQRPTPLRCERGSGAPQGQQAPSSAPLTRITLRARPPGSPLRIANDSGRNRFPPPHPMQPHAKKKQHQARRGRCAHHRRRCGSRW